MDHVSRAFPPDVLAVDDVSLTIYPGEFVALTGPSGSGKSTLLNILGLLDRPTSGTYELEGVPSAGMADRELARLRGGTIGFVFQAFHLVPHLTAVENVALGLAYAPPGTLEGADPSEALEAVGMGHRADAFPGTLSGGERQRVAIARAVARSPRLLLCDEPTGNLDSRATEALLEILEDRLTPDRALLVVTHEADVAARAHRVVRMHDGRLVEAGE